MLLYSDLLTRLMAIWGHQSLWMQVSQKICTKTSPSAVTIDLSIDVANFNCKPDSGIRIYRTILD